jgi:ribosomal protein S18 acetylase RimI-like enzyme
MKGPSDQAKLFLLGLFKTVSAFATQNGSTSISNAWWPHLRRSTAMSATRLDNIPNTLNSLQQDSQLQIPMRLARRTDVPGITSVNLASLPENYNPPFYTAQLREWPELALVAECTSDPTTSESLSYSSFPTRHRQDAKIVAYILGKVEATNTGHVTSLAVLDSYRRHGLATALLDQLHLHLRVCHAVDKVGLHVRPSNRGALRLYQDVLGYELVEKIPAYYHDGEEAYLLQKDLTTIDAVVCNDNINTEMALDPKSPHFWNAWKRQDPSMPWTLEGPWQLPRSIVGSADQKRQPSKVDSDTDLLSGTM